MLSRLAHDDALWAIAILALVIGAVDTIWAILRALRDDVFSREYVAEFLTGHVALRFGPIVLLAVVASVTSALTATSTTLPATLIAFAPGVWAAAWAGLLAYLGETVASLKATGQGQVLGAYMELEHEHLPTEPLRFEPRGMQITTATVDERHSWPTATTIPAGVNRVVTAPRVGTDGTAGIQIPRD